VKFTATTSDLRDALERAGKVVPATPSQLVFGGVKVAVAAGRLTVTGSAEGDTTVTVTVPATDTAAGEKVVEPKPILTFLAGLAPSTPVDASAGTGPELRLHPRGGGPYTFRVLEATFPSTSVPAAHVHPVDLTDLPTAVRGVKGAASKSRLVNLTSRPDRVDLSATDGARLAHASLPGVTFGEFTGLLPLDVLDQISDIAATSVALDRRGRVLTAASDQVTIITRVVEDQFPNVESVLGNRPAVRAHIPVRQTTQALARLAAVADQRPVKVHITGDQLTLESVAASGPGSGQEHIMLTHPASGDVTFAVNLNYWRDALTAHAADTVALAWSSPEAAVFVDSTDPVPITTVVMPVRLS
jgi:DNA polymerase III sliding clamp (beta) subunit (PCNA family)